MPAPVISLDNAAKPPFLAPAEKRFLLLITLLSLLVGLCYVFTVRAGTPYDEPAHYNVVQLYRHTLQMPVIGEAGTQYEVYQPPFYYFMASLAARAVGFADEKTVFLAVRIFSLALYLPCLWMVYLMAREIAGSQRFLPVVSVLFIGLNPCILAIVSSVQNDGLSILLSVLTTYLCVQWIAKSELTFGRTLVLALVVSLAMLTKLSGAFLAITTPLYMLFIYRQRAVKFAAVFLGVIVLFISWWFVRNIRLYGEVTGEKTMLKFTPAGLSWKPLHPLRPYEDFKMLQSIVTYWWLPVEYFRNLFHSPRGVTLFVIFFTLFGLAGCVWWLFQRRQDKKPGLISYRVGWLLAMQYSVLMLVYLRTSMLYWAVPARITLVCLMVPALVVGGGGLYACVKLLKNSERGFALVLGVSLLLINAVMLWQVARTSVGAFNLFV